MRNITKSYVETSDKNPGTQVRNRMGFYHISTLWTKSFLISVGFTVSFLKQSQTNFSRSLPVKRFYELGSPLKNKQQNMSDKQFNGQPRHTKS